MAQTVKKKKSTCNEEDMGLIPGLGRSPGGGQWEEIDYKQQVSTC